MLNNDYLRIAPFINDCPACGESDLEDENGGQIGTYELKEDLITRTCHCGFAITIDSKNGTSKKILKETVAKAVDEFNKRKKETE